jgi:DNA-binding NtrC family response regulator
MEVLIRYDWPGNVRELKNVIERAMLLDADEEILLDHLPPEIHKSQSSPIAGDKAAAHVLTSFFPMTLREVERIQIERTLEQTNGNKSKAAGILGISRQTLREKLKTFNNADAERAAKT